MRVVQVFQQNQEPAAFSLEDFKTKTCCADILNARKQRMSQREGIQRLKIKKPLTDQKNAA